MQFEKFSLCDVIISLISYDIQIWITVLDWIPGIWLDWRPQLVPDLPQRSKGLSSALHTGEAPLACQFEFIIDWVDQWECRRVAFGLLCVHRCSSSVGSAKRWGSQWHRCRSCWCGLRTLPRVFKVCVHDACACLGILRSPCLLLRKQEHLLFVF